MFLDFFYALRAQKVPVSTHEWIALLSALKKGLVDSDLGRFYFVSRALLVKNEALYDVFDGVFLHFFRAAAEPRPIDDRVRDWLNRTPLERYFSPEELERLKKLDLDELRSLFEERLREQNEAHHGGNRWIGTGGTSPFGHGGFHPTGIRVGGASGGRSAVKIAAERRYRNYRHDLTLDVRQMQVALRKLRDLRRFGAPDELDLDATVDRTCRNAGEIELMLRPEKRNRTKLLLLMDAGGTMDPYAHLVSLLFSAAHSSSHFKDFRHYYFHNCVYSRVYRDIERSDAVPTADLFRLYDENYRLIVVGDAWMNPYELHYAGGEIDFFAPRGRDSGAEWLKRLAGHFKKAAWLNPERLEYWEADTIAAIRSIFKMYPLTLEGLHDAVRALR